MNKFYISMEVDELIWKELRLIEQKVDKSLSILLEDAVKEYIKAHRVSELNVHLMDTLRDNFELAELLSKS